MNADAVELGLWALWIGIHLAVLREWLRTSKDFWVGALAFLLLVSGVGLVVFLDGRAKGAW